MMPEKDLPIKDLFQSPESRTVTATFKCNDCGATVSKTRPPSDSKSISEDLGANMANILTPFEIQHGYNEGCPKGGGKKFSDYTLVEASVVTGVDFTIIQAVWEDYLAQVTGQSRENNS